MKKATSQDVARLAGVSQATVSLILNNSDKITFSSETKERVFAAAQELNYELPRRKKQPNKKKQPYAFGADSHLDESILFRIDSSGGRLRGFSGIPGDCLQTPFVSPDLEKYYLDTFLGSHVDGLIYTFLPSFPHLIEQVSSTTPVVIIGEKEEDLAICSIELSNVNAGAMLAEHLYQLGHRKLAFLSTPFNQFTLARGQRLEGIRRQLESHGLTDGLKAIVEDPRAETDMQDGGLPYEYIVGRRLAAEFLRRKEDATALIGVNDMTALGILNELQAQGFHIPRDYSVCGFDNIFASSVTTPTLTTIDHHLYTRCRSAVDMILSQNEKRASAQPAMVNKIEYTPQLIVRGSTGPCGTTA